MFRADAGNTGAMVGPGPDPDGPIVERWRHELEDIHQVARFDIDSNAAFVDGIVYFGGVDGSVRAVEPASGEEIWTFWAPYAIWGTPAVADGVLYAVSLDLHLYAIDTATGEQVWTFAFGEPRNSYNWQTSSPTVANGMVYFGGADGILYAVDAVTGSEVWRNEFTSAVISTPAVVDGVVYATSMEWDSGIRALDAATGALKWETEDISVYGALTVANGVMYVSRYEGLTALDVATGSEIWSTNLAGATTAYSSPAVADGLVVVGHGSKVFAVDAATGVERWQFQTNGTTKFVRSSPAVADGIVFVGSNDTNVYALDLETGAGLWEFALDGEVRSSPVVAAGFVFVGGRSGTMVALGAPSEEMLQQTVAAESATQTAEAHIAATETAEANTRATEQAGYDATATAEAEVRATEQAIEDTWDGYFEAIGVAMADSPDLPSSMAIGSPDTDMDESGRYAQYPVTIAGGGGETVITIGVFASSDDAAVEFASVTDGLLRSGWQTESIDGLGETVTCASIVRADETEAACLSLQGDTILASHSYIDAEAREAAVLNVTDLIRLADAAYSSVDRPQS